jgi:SAM-dependent methyltransferase
MSDPNLYDDHYFSIMRGDGDLPEESELHGQFIRLARKFPLERMRVLDAGCGRGELLSLLRKAGAMEVSGFDFSPAAVATSRDLLSRTFDADEMPTVSLASIEDASLFPADRFDLIFMTDLVEHLPQAILERGLGNIRRWLTPQGQAIIHTFPTLGPHRLFRLYLSLTGHREMLRKVDAIHCNVQTRRRLRIPCGARGLNVHGCGYKTMC